MAGRVTTAMIRRAPFRFSVITLFSLGAVPAVLRAQEARPGSVPEPPVRTGLVLHFDAAAQNEARRAAALEPVMNGRPVDRWLDVSGGPLQAVQPVADSRPVHRDAGHLPGGGPEAASRGAFLRFDGKDDFLPVAGPRRLSPELTVLVLAAPRGNPGNFSALFATAEASRNDYTHGLNLDFGPAPGKELSVLNLETAGAQGFQDMLVPGHNLAADLPFGSFHVFTARSRIGKEGNEVFLDGIRLGARTRLESNIGLDLLSIGSRLCSNDPGQPPFAQGFFQGDLAAVLVYDRALGEEDRTRVEQYLFDRTPALNALAAGHQGHALETVKDPPVVQMLVPGFSVEELPLKLTNLTNVRYRHDGKLVALGYDGRIHLAWDSDGDGREDKSSIFWDKSSLRGPIGMVCLPRGDPRGDGVFVSSKGKVSLILDRGRDGVADEEIIAATGWKENFTNVDATGLAVDPRDGSLYFCLGVEDFSNAYLVDRATGKSNFSIGSERGTIQKVSADFKTRETVCTGVRFACALAFNREGDLFATEQEGATWLPNGNPFDELLHIRPGLHYGFPPRHPKHLPQVVDEPPVFDYGPQHQSTVGMVFNEGVNGGPAFGPPAWEGNALVCGESRGKLYRTQLVKTPEGYVAANHIVACLTMLTVDTCVTPAGDLLVACHSGPPDWGTGPTGEGRIFRIRYTGRETPQPVTAWAAGPDEFRVAFDRVLEVSDWAGILDRVKIEAGRYVAPGDRYEIIRPGYQVVRDQMAAPRQWIKPQSLSLTPDRRTLVLRVPAVREAVPAAVTLPVPVSWRSREGIPQQPEMDVALTLNGVVAGAGGRRVVLPHPDLVVARAFTAGSADHEAFFAALEPESPQDGGVLTFSGLADDTNIFQPAAQPGSTLDWDPATDAFGRRRTELRTASGREEALTVVSLPETGTGTGGIPWVPWTLKTRGPRDRDHRLVFAVDDRVRPAGPHRLYVPWAVPPGQEVREKGPRTDVKGSWLAGRQLFFGQGTCFTCHSIRGEGVVFGPDLTNLVHRDRGSVLHDILEPSAAINPDQAGSRVVFRDGSVVQGLVRTLTEERIVLLLQGGALLEKPRGEVAEIGPLKESLMPEAPGRALTETQREDLLTFLLTNPLEPAAVTRLDPPPPPARSRAEVEPFLTPLAGAGQTVGSPVADGGVPALKPLRILLGTDPKDHGTDEHDYPLWSRRWKTLLSLAPGVSVQTCEGFPSAALLAKTDVAVFYSRNAGWNPRAAALMDEYQERGGGLVYLHWAMEGGREAEALSSRIGLATSFSRFRHGPVELEFTQPDHPITRGFRRLSLVDETYWALRGDPGKVAVLAQAREENADEPQLWTLQRGKARVFGCIPGHYTWTFDDPLYRVLVLRGIAWAAGEAEVDRLTGLATVGARLAP